MDLRSIINVEGDGSAPRQASATPVTPVQPGPNQQSFRDYHVQPQQQQQLHQSHASPSNHTSIDYGATPSPQASLGNHQQFYGQPQSGSLSYASPIAYQRPPPPPPIQAQHEFRSPANSYSGQSAQSPYRQTPTSGLGSSSSNQYPFPLHQTPQSPAQHQQYPSPQLQHHNSQGHNFPPSVPQTPPTPIGIPASTHPYIHRSQSSLSASTPTSAHSQPPYFNQPNTPSIPMPETQRSGSGREHSLSVSPKTQPTKRKLGEIGDSPQNSHARQVSMPYTNGNAIKVSPKSDHRTSSSTRPSINGDTPPPKRRRYSQKPIWAQSWKGNQPTQVRSEVQQPRPVPVQQPAVAMAPSPVPPSSKVIPGAVHTLTGKLPSDPIGKVVADFLYTEVVGRTDWGELDSWNKSSGLVLEIEAKLGHLIDRNTNERYHDPKIGSPCIFRGQMVGFRSNMTVTQHKALNDFLNKQVQDAAAQNFRRQPGRTEIKYKHTRLIDKFYELPRNATPQFLPPVLLQYHNPHHLLKVRVTHDKTTNAVQEKIIKGRIADLSIFNPTGLFDCRISINYEINYEGDMKLLQVGDQQPDRYKDRLSYSMAQYQVDLTKVETSINGVKQGPDDHELEIEISTNALREHGSRAAAGQPNEYLEIVQGLVDNLRILTSAAN